MNRIRQLQALSMEHHLSLSLAAKAIRIAQSGDCASIQALCLDIIEQYERN